MDFSVVAIVVREHDPADQRACLAVGQPDRHVKRHWALVGHGEHPARHIIIMARNERDCHSGPPGAAIRSVANQSNVSAPERTRTSGATARP